MQEFLCVASFGLIACTAAAQNPLGVLRNTIPGHSSRGGGAAANFNPAVVWNRIDSGKYAAWGTDSSRPGMRVFTGLHFVVQDENLATQDTFALVAYGESPSTPNYPETGTPLATTGNFTLPAGTGGGAFEMTANFATPVQAPAANDVYVGVRLNGPGLVGNPVDGLSVWVISGAPIPTSTIAGFGLPTTPFEATTFGGYYIPSTGTLTYSPSTQFAIEPIATSAGGVCSALDPANLLQPPPGTANMFSGLHPDARTPPRNAGRADNVGMTFLMSGLADGTPVFFLADLSGAFGPEQPLTGLLAGSTGNVCVDLVSAQTVAIGTTTNGIAWNVIVIPASVRGSIAGIALIHQCAALDFLTGVAHAGPCSMQSF